jgi:glucokinase
MHRIVGTEGTVNNMLAVDIGGAHLRVGLFDQEGRRLLVSEDETQAARGREWVLAQVHERCHAFLEKTDYPVRACGVSFGGPVDFERQRATSIHSPGWQGFPLAQWVQETLNLPCQIDNDANAGALGEFRFGAGRGTQSLVYIALSTGIGSGLICDGKILRGKDSLAGELGHVPVSDSGAPCSCGAKGCLEVFCSGMAIARRGQEWANRRPEAVARMLELSGGKVEGINSKAVMQAAAEGDMAAAHIVREAARWLARGLLTVIRIVNPDRIVLGGGVSQVGTALLNPVHVFLEEFGSPTIGYSTQVVLAELGALSPLYGAAAMAMALA